MTIFNKILMFDNKLRFNCEVSLWARS